LIFGVKKLAIRPDFSVQLPKKILFGEGAAKEIPKLVKGFNSNSVLFITDPTIRKIGLSDQILNSLEKAGIQTEVFDQVELEPSIKAAEKVIEVSRKSEFDLVIGMGGGSSLDMAKLASISATNAGPLKDFVGVGMVKKPGVPKILIPTTSGTGSEITMNSIISDKENKLKMGIVTPYIIADVALIDPLLTTSMPPKVTSSTGLDALTHAVESLISIDLNPFSELFAIDAIKRIFRYLPKAYHDGKNIEARREMCLASMFAGISLGISGVCAGHAAAYSFTISVPHGVGCAIALPYIMELNATSCLDKMVKIAKAAGVTEEGANQKKNAYNAVNAVRDLIKEVGNPLSLKEIGISDADIESMAKKMLTIKRLLAHNPKDLSEKDTEKLFRRMYEGLKLPLDEY
jgi:alcohol dehydrogenase class IV